MSIEQNREADPAGLAEIPELVRCEQFDREALGERITELTHTVYRHEQVYGPFITIHEHIDCPPEKVFAYLANPYSLLEWTYSVRELRPAGRPGLLVGVDSGRTPIYCRTVTHEGALTVDYHCAWDQGDELWMVYLNRIVPAETALKKPGSVVIWTNCRHPYYAQNPFPSLCQDPKREWVGDWWPLFYAEVAHRIGARARWIVDLHNAGCVSFIYMIELARMIMSATDARGALLCNVQNAGGRVFADPEIRLQSQAPVPGDGCGVGYVAASDVSPVLSVIHEHHGDFARDMDAAAADGRRYWQPGPSPIGIRFTEQRVASIIERGNRLVPDLVARACQEAGVRVRDIDLLVTNQPNSIFVRNWHEALELPRRRITTRSTGTAISSVRPFPSTSRTPSA